MYINNLAIVKGYLTGERALDILARFLHIILFVDRYLIVLVLYRKLVAEPRLDWNWL